MKSIYLLDLNKKIIRVLKNDMTNSKKIVNDILSRDLDSFTNKLSLTLDNTEKDNIEMIQYIYYPVTDDKYGLYKIINVMETSNANGQEVSFECISYEQYLLLKNSIDETTFHEEKVDSIVNYILLDSDIKFGYTNIDNSFTFAIEGSVPKLKALVDFCTSFSLEYEFTYSIGVNSIIDMRVNILDKIGTNKGQIFINGKNIDSTTRKRDDSKLITALRSHAVGNGMRFTFNDIENVSLPVGYSYTKGTDYIVSDIAYAKYNENGRHLWGVFEDDSASNQYELFSNTLDILMSNDTPKYEYDIVVTSIEEQLRNGLYCYDLGDEVTIIDSTLSPEITLRARIRSQESSLTNPDINTITLGDYQVVKPIRQTIEDTIKNVIDDLTSIDLDYSNRLPYTNFDDPFLEVTKASLKITNGKIENVLTINEEDTISENSDIVGSSYAHVIPNGGNIRVQYAQFQSVNVGRPYTFSFQERTNGSLRPFIILADNERGDGAIEYFGDVVRGGGKFNIATKTMNANKRYMTVGFQMEDGNSVDFCHFMLSKSQKYVPWFQSIIEGNDISYENSSKIADIKIEQGEIKQFATETSNKLNITDGKLNNVEVRVSTAEQKITPTAIVNSVSTALNNGESITTNSTRLDDTGYYFLENGKKSVGMRENGLHIYSVYSENKINGGVRANKTIDTGDDIAALVHEQDTFCTISWRKSENIYTSYISFDILNKLGGIGAIKFHSHAHFNDVISTWKAYEFISSIGHTSIAQGDYNNLGLAVNIKPNHGENTYAFGVNGAQFLQPLKIFSDLQVTGNKNCIVQTESFGDVKFYANEDTSSLLTDTVTSRIFETICINDEYLCKIDIDPLVQECINTSMDYNIYIDKLSFGDYMISERHKDYFIIKSDKPLKFKYKLEGRRMGFENERKTYNRNANLKMEKDIDIASPMEANVPYTFA